ncbi:hypothetical protein [Stutzerimonas kunmingensis]|uniref:hypothetical protein n=1 Tax=Stutzerimonas kunmingensis TaxID=1211807 RepID=UPI00242038D0|nr:hypothetical protein [Stutzerimonas kunmingensis]
MGAAKKLPLISPFLASAAILRTGESKLPGHYSNEKDMWVVETESGVKPVIARGALAELLTKTRQDEEQDDDTLFMLETITKTYHRTESDDESFSGPSQVLELLSKTDTISERDDPGSANFILELLTKTHVELESDDTGPSMGLDTRFYED